MKMLYLATKYPPPLEGGSWVFLYNLVSHMPASEVMVYTNARPNHTAFDATQAYHIIRSRCLVRDFSKLGRARMWLEWIVSLALLLLREKADILHVGDLFGSGLPAWVVARLLRKPYVVYTYGEELNRQRYRSDRVWGALRGGIYSLVIRGADGYVTVSDYTTTLLEALGVDRQKVLKVIPMIAPAKYVVSEKLEHVRTRYGLVDGQPMILSVGRLIERKGQDFLIRAMPQVLAAFPDALLIVASRGPDAERLQRLAGEVGVRERVIFAGFVPEDELSALYALCDVFAMPHRETRDGNTEGCPTVFLEANVHGKPVVGGQAGGVRDAILDGETGFIVDGEQPDEIAAAVVKLLGDPELARRLGETGRRRVLYELSPQRGAAKVLAFSRRILEQKVCP